MRILRPIIHLLILVLVVFLLYQFVIFPFFTPKTRVIHVLDADTLMVMEDGKVEKVQLIGIDAPEVAGPDHDIVQCYHDESRKAAAAYFKEHQGINLESDKQLGNTDVHNRLLRYVKLLDGRYLNEELLRKGFAREFHPADKSYTKEDEFLSLQKEAQSDNRGLWEACNGQF